MKTRLEFHDCLQFEVVRHPDATRFPACGPAVRVSGCKTWWALHLDSIGGKIVAVVTHVPTGRRACYADEIIEAERAAGVLAVAFGDEEMVDSPSAAKLRAARARAALEEAGCQVTINEPRVS